MMRPRSTELDRISKFLESVWERKIWVLTTTLFLASCAFVFKVWSAWPKEIEERQRMLIEDRYTLEEARRVPEVRALIQGILDDFSVFFDLYGKSVQTEIPLSQATYEELLQRLSKLEDRLNYAKGYLQGITFLDDARKEFLNGEREIVARYEPLVNGYRAVIEERKVTGDPSANEIQLLTNITNISAFVSGVAAQFPRLTKDLELITNRSKTTVNVVRSQLYLTIPAIVYILLWIVFAIQAYWGNRI